MAWAARHARSRWPGLLVPLLAGPLLAGVIGTGVSAAEPAAPTLAALRGDDTLLVFRVDRPEEARAVPVRGVSDPLLAIDTRPANGRLYGVTAAAELYTIDPSTGAATRVSTLTRPFDGDGRSGADFHPARDRLRLISHDGQNLRINVDVGATALDGPLFYARDDRHAGARPAIAAVAYTNNVAGTHTTTMFNIDAGLDALVIQEPPNAGLLRTVGPLTVDAPARAGFEVVTDRGGRNTGFAAFGTSLYRIDLETGAATALGTIANATSTILGLAVVPEAAVPETP